MSRATLTITPLPNGGRRIAVECEHATTYGGDLRTAALAEAAIVAFLVLRHRRGTDCRCARRLERQFPPELIPPELRVVELMA